MHLAKAIASNWLPLCTASRGGGGVANLVKFQPAEKGEAATRLSQIVAYLSATIHRRKREIRELLERNACAYHICTFLTFCTDFSPSSRPDPALGSILNYTLPVPCSDIRSIDDDVLALVGLLCKY